MAAIAAGLKIPRVDELLVRAVSVMDEKQARALYREIEQLVVQAGALGILLAQSQLLHPSALGEKLYGRTSCRDGEVDRDHDL